MNIFGELETFLSEDLYPYRYPIAIAAVLVFVAGAVVAWRLGIQRALWRHRLVTVAAGVPLVIVLGVAANYLFSPLFERSFLDEASPIEAVVRADQPSPSGGAPAAAAAMLKRSGSFMGADSFHFARGRALLIETTPGVWVVRFEDFSVRNGPDLYVYLSRGDTSRVEESLNLGRLKATDGAFNYEIPAGIDVSSIKSVVVWCRQFTVLFGAAHFEPA